MKGRGAGVPRDRRPVAFSIRCRRWPARVPRGWSATGPPNPFRRRIPSRRAPSPCNGPRARGRSRAPMAAPMAAPIGPPAKATVVAINESLDTSVLRHRADDRLDALDGSDRGAAVHALQDSMLGTFPTVQSLLVLVAWALASVSSRCASPGGSEPQAVNRSPACFSVWPGSRCWSAASRRRSPRADGSASRIRG